jgi:(p)ppGpp synthase/HD superfamily hydrolase
MQGVTAVRNATWGFEPRFLDRRPLTRIAFGLAAKAHAAQRRDTDEVPYIIHPLEAAALLHSFGLDDQVTAAAMLHDTLEDTDLSEEQIEERVDGRVIHLVRALTDDERIDDERERKAALRERVAAAGPEAALVFAADKLSKVRELRTRLSRDADAGDRSDSAVKLEHYRASVQMLEDLLERHPLVEQLAFEVEALEALPPHGRFVG